jgi:hypothetical protein
LESAVMKGKDLQAGLDMMDTKNGIRMGIGPGAALHSVAGVHPEWHDPTSAPPKQVYSLRAGELICLELNEANLADGLEWIERVQSHRAKKHQAPANILAACRSRRLPWKRREWMREKITATGAVFFEVEADRDPRIELQGWLETTPQVSLV